MENELIGDERTFLHKLTNALAIAHGSVHALQTIQERDGGLSAEPVVVKRLTSACNSLDELVEIVGERRQYLEAEVSQ